MKVDNKSLALGAVIGFGIAYAAIVISKKQKMKIALQKQLSDSQTKLDSPTSPLATQAGEETINPHTNTELTTIQAQNSDVSAQNGTDNQIQEQEYASQQQLLQEVDQILSTLPPQPRSGVLNGCRSYLLKRVKMQKPEIDNLSDHDLMVAAISNGFDIGYALPPNLKM